MSGKKKSGLRSLKSGELLFEDGASADSLYIIQRGQIRLYKPKGKGFIEIAVLRKGEVVGEMGFFDEGKGQSRSCAAEAIAPSEVIEVSYAAFGKTIESLNPWFKTIFTTLASRLRKTNAKVKALESNSVSHGYGGDNSYKFMTYTDIVKTLAMIFLVMNSHGEKDQNGQAVHMKTMTYYAQDIFNITESKFLAFLNILKDIGLALFTNDQDGFLKIFVIKNVQIMRTQMVFFNAQRASADDKRIEVSEKCMMFLERIYELIVNEQIEGDKAEIDITPIISDYKNRNVAIGIEDLADALRGGYVSEPILGEGGKVGLLVRVADLKKDLFSLRLLNEVEKVNRSKLKGKYT